MDYTHHEAGGVLHTLVKIVGVVDGLEAEVVVGVLISVVQQKSLDHDKAFHIAIPVEVKTSLLVNSSSHN